MTPARVASHVNVGQGGIRRGRGRVYGKRFRQAEVQYDDLSLRGHFDVGRLQVAVDDPFLVGRLHGLVHLPRHAQSFFHRKATLQQSLGQCLSRDQLHHQVVPAFGLLEAVDGGDIRMIERRERLGLTLESREPFFVAREFLGQDLDRYFPSELGVTCAVDLSHASHAEKRQDLVLRELRAGRQAHIYSALDRSVAIEAPRLHDARGDLLD